MTAWVSHPKVLISSFILLGWSLLLPTSALPKVFFYGIDEEDGTLIKYDPDADQIVEFKQGAGQGYINRRNTDPDDLGPTRVLDVARGRIVTFFNDDPGVVLLDLASGKATEIAVGPPATMDALRHIVYPRRSSRVYVFWVRRQTPADAPEAVLTAVDLTGRILGTTPSLVAMSRGHSLAHPDGRTFYVLNQPNLLLRVDGETLAVHETRPGDLSPAWRDTEWDRRRPGWPRPAVGTSWHSERLLRRADPVHGRPRHADFIAADNHRTWGEHRPACSGGRHYRSLGGPDATRPGGCGAAAFL